MSGCSIVERRSWVKVEGREDLARDRSVILNLGPVPTLCLLLGCGLSAPGAGRGDSTSLLTVNELLITGDKPSSVSFWVSNELGKFFVCSLFGTVGLDNVMIIGSPSLVMCEGWICVSERDLGSH